MKREIKIALKYIFLFVLFSAGTIFINVCNFYTNILGHIDIPNHFFGGIVAAVPLFILLPKISGRESKIVATILYLSLIGFGWEKIEIMALEAGYSSGNLFVETPFNKATDLFFGLAGFIAAPRLVLNTKIKDLYRAGKRKFF